MIGIEQLYEGSHYTICGITVNNRSPLKSFLNSLGESAKTKVYYLMQKTADHGLPRNKEKFRKIIGQELWEFKAGQVRIICFFERQRIVICTHGFIKKREKTPGREIEKAKGLMKMYMEGRRGK